MKRNLHLTSCDSLYPGLFTAANNLDKHSDFLTVELKETYYKKL